MPVMPVMPVMHDLDIGGTSPWMDKGRIMQELLSRAKLGENHEMMVLSERHGSRIGLLTRRLLPESKEQLPASSNSLAPVFALKTQYCLSFLTNFRPFFPTECELN